MASAAEVGETIGRGIGSALYYSAKLGKWLVRDVAAKGIGKNVLYEGLGKKVIAPAAKGVFRDLPKASFKKMNQARKWVGKNFIAGAKKLKNGLIETPNKVRLGRKAAKKTANTTVHIANVFNPINIIRSTVQDAKDLATMFVMEPLDVAKETIQDVKQMVSHTGGELKQVLTQSGNTTSLPKINPQKSRASKPNKYRHITPTVKQMKPKKTSPSKIKKMPNPLKEAI